MNSKTRQHRNNDRGGRGRGRGKNPPPGKEANKATSTTSTSPTPIRNSDNKTLKRNGEKGAEAHTVSEETRIQFTKMMIDFREDHQMDALEMPKDLTNTERKFLHQLAGQLGLKSKSSGKGDDRRITITKAGDNERKRAPGLGSQIPLLHIGANGEAALDSYIREFPPDEVEAAESTETGSSLRNGSATKVLSTLEQLKIQSSSNVQSKKPKTKSVNLESRVAMHRKYQQAKLQNPTFQSILAARKQLPALAYEKEICDIVRENQVTLLSGDTGCGKSTQLPQFLLDDPDMGPTCKVCITQPRRISAMTIAERVASERCEEVGSVVGYNVRLESCSSPSTQLLFVTPGILLRKFQSSPDLEEFTHIVIDEIHERDRYTEFLMIALKELINRRSDLRIVLMSATIQTNELLQYWTGAGCLKENIDERIPADINIPGRMFPVQTFFLEDVLAMTGFVGDESALMTGDLTDLETDLSKLLGSLNDKPKSKSKKGKSKVLATKDHSLVCVLCNQSGFKCPEELGSHIGLCMGSGNMTASDLETKVRKTHVVSTWEQQEANGGSNVDDDVLVDVIEEDQEIIVDDDDNDALGLHEGHWDGSSPFGVADIITNTKNSFSEEDMLNRYHLMHDDEQVDNDLILNIIRYIHKSSYGDGAILVFLPGWMEISELSMILESTSPFSDKSQFLILPMHSGIPSKDQRLVFQRPRRGVRKIVLSTNICEASVTIDDVAFVIDTGRAKEKSYDPHLNTSTLQPIWISQASAKQRRGRAGRTKAGVCFHLFSRRRHASFREFLESEMIRTSLEEICLQCKKLNLCPGGINDVDGIPSFLSRALTPPHPKAVLNAITDLVRLGAMEIDTNDLTKLGHCLACLSVEPKVGKMVIWSYILGCSKDTASIAVAMSYKTPFIIPPTSMRKHADEAKVQLSGGSESDQVLILNVLNMLDQANKSGNKNSFRQDCRRSFINIGTLEMISSIRKNVSKELESIGYPSPNLMNTWYNRNSNGSSLFSLQASVVAGLYPNVAVREEGEANFRTMANQKAKMHISSVNSCKGMPLSKKSTELEFVAFGELLKGVSTYTINQTTHLPSVLPILLLCGDFRIRTLDSEGNDMKYSVITIDEWISFRCEYKIGSTLAVLRSRLETIFFHFVSSSKHSWDDFNDNERSTLAAFDAVSRSSFKASSR